MNALGPNIRSGTLVKRDPSTHAARDGGGIQEREEVESEQATAATSGADCGSTPLRVLDGIGEALLFDQFTD